MPMPLAKLVLIPTPKRRWAPFRLGTTFIVVMVRCVCVAAASSAEVAVAVVDGEPRGQTGYYAGSFHFPPFALSVLDNNE